MLACRAGAVRRRVSSVVPVFVVGLNRSGSVHFRKELHVNI